VTEKKVEIDEKSGEKKVLEEKKSSKQPPSGRPGRRRPRAAPPDPKAKKKPAPAEKANHDHEEPDDPQRTVHRRPRPSSPAARASPATQETYRADTRSLVETKNKALKDCYDAALVADPKLDGR
jgi:hypothetical protein